MANRTPPDRGRARRSGPGSVLVFLHDVALFGFLRLVSPRFRAHEKYVKDQGEHLHGLHADAPAEGCDYCRLRVEDGYFERRARTDLTS